MAKAKEPAALSPPARAGQGRKMRPRVVTAEYVAGLEAYAKLLHKGGLTPKGADRPDRIAVLIEIGRDVGLPATMAVSWIAIIGGRPSIWGDGAMALIRASGLLESIREGYEGEPGTDGFTAWVEMKRVGATEPRVSRFSLADADRAKLTQKVGPWQEYPDRMLMWRAKGFAARDEFQDVLCGLIFAEEALDMPRVVVTSNGPGVDPDQSPPAAPAERTLPAGPPSAVDSAAGPAPMSFAQAEEITRLRQLYLARRNMRGGTEEAAQAWDAFVCDNSNENARSLKRMSEAAAAVFLKDIGAELDPAAYLPAPADQAEATTDAEQSVRVPITDAQVEEIIRLRTLFLQGKSIFPLDSDEAAAAWAEFVFVNTAPRPVRSANHLTAPQADRFCVVIGEQLDPFTYPTKQPPAG